MNEVTPVQKARAVLWLSELKSVENVNQRWLYTYKSEPPSENTLKTWMENFTKFGNLEDPDQLSLPREEKHSGLSSNPDKKQKDRCANQQTEYLNNLQQSQSFGGDSFSFCDKTITFENIRKLQEDFCNERNWNQYHSPRNILLALVGEVGELAEIFQWKGEVKKGIPSFTDAEKEHLGEELSDVLIYLIRLADRCEIDLPLAALKKIEKNAKKYPVNKVYGKSKKYNEYQSS